MAVLAGAVRVAGNAWLRFRGGTVRGGAAWRPRQNRTAVSGSRETRTHGVGSLDPASRRRAAWFAWRCLALAAWAIGVQLARGQSLQDCAALLDFACGIGGFVSMLFARVHGEPLWRGSLNGWDEALAFVAVSRLAHFAAHVPA